jgi:hypothetical protein
VPRFAGAPHAPQPQHGARRAGRPPGARGAATAAFPAAPRVRTARCPAAPWLRRETWCGTAPQASEHAALSFSDASGYRGRPSVARLFDPPRRDSLGPASSPLPSANVTPTNASGDSARPESPRTTQRRDAARTRRRRSRSCSGSPPNYRPVPTGSPRNRPPVFLPPPTARSTTRGSCWPSTSKPPRPGRYPVHLSHAIPHALELPLAFHPHPCPVTERPPLPPPCATPAAPEPRPIPRSPPALRTPKRRKHRAPSRKPGRASPRGLPLHTAGIDDPALPTALRPGSHRGNAPASVPIAVPMLAKSRLRSCHRRRSLQRRPR